MTAASFITARLKSTRLPHKVLKPLGGRPMIAHLVERMKLSCRIDRIVLCTSTIADDDPLETFAASAGIDCFRGDPDDVLARLTAAAHRFAIDVVASCSADNPFVDPVAMDALIDFHVAGGYDYCRSIDLPWGAFTSTIGRAAMARACTIKDALDTEVWGGYFTETGLFKVGTLNHRDPTICRPALRLTVDEPADFELASQIVERLGANGRTFSLDEIVALLDRSPELVAINAHVRQKTPLPIKVRSARAA